MRLFVVLLFAMAINTRGGEHFDAAPYARVAEEGRELIWDDPREIHSVTVEFAQSPAGGAKYRLEYWGSHWPKDHLPKDREPGGGDNGWVELGNWYKGGWRVADAEESVSNNSVRFRFRPINEHEYPELKDYNTDGRFTLKIRVASDALLPKVLRIEALTDSTSTDRVARVVWKNRRPANFEAVVFNGEVIEKRNEGELATLLKMRAAANTDPNTFDRTLVTLRNGSDVFTFKADDLQEGALYLPEYGAAILPEKDGRDYEAVAKEAERKAGQTLYDRVAEMPEQTWKSAWEGMPPKKSRICFVLGMDGSRQKFRLDNNGRVFIRWNDQYMKAVPARDTPRIELEKPPVQIDFGLSRKPAERHIEEESIPTCFTTWDLDGLRITQTAFATTLSGMKTREGPPAPDECLVAMLRFEITNGTSTERKAELPITISGGEKSDHLRVDDQGLIWNGNQLRGQIVGGGARGATRPTLNWSETLAPGASTSVIVKMPYLPLIESSEARALSALDFDMERKKTDDYWRDVLDRSSRLITPEPILNDFYRAVPGHLLINSEFEPGSDRRLARVGSFNYGNYGNESCMMVLDLDRRGYHREAAECLEAWLHYQGTVPLPGNFDSKEGVLYGAGGYEANGYNQHHGWILWTIVQHYRFTRDDAWLRRVAPNIVAAADWIIKESSKFQTSKATHGGIPELSVDCKDVSKLIREDLGQGLLPPGELEDIGDWWTWLSTSCYTWVGLDSAAWALEQLHHPEARRIRAAANAYHTNLVQHFLAASARSPVVRLRDGTAVPQIPSYAQRRGRSFGWISETLEGAMHLVITRAIDPKSVQAQWILKDYEDNLFLSNQYGYTLDNFDKHWFGRGGMSMQACLLLDPEAYLYRDDVKQALRAMFNAIALNHFSDVHMNTEHALPEMGDWRGDHYKTSDEANACGWLRYLFVREEGETLLIGQAIPREWLKPAQKCGIENAATFFGNTSVIYRGETGRIVASLNGPTRNSPREIRVRFRTPGEKPLKKVTVNGRLWKKVEGDWVILPGKVGRAEIVVEY